MGLKTFMPMSISSRVSRLRRLRCSRDRLMPQLESLWGWINLSTRVKCLTSLSRRVICRSIQSDLRMMLRMEVLFEIMVRMGDVYVDSRSLKTATLRSYRASLLEGQDSCSLNTVLVSLDWRSKNQKSLGRNRLTLEASQTQWMISQKYSWRSELSPSRPAPRMGKREKFSWIWLREYRWSRLSPLWMRMIQSSIDSQRLRGLLQLPDKHLNSIQMSCWRASAIPQLKLNSYTIWQMILTFWHPQLTALMKDWQDLVDLRSSFSEFSSKIRMYSRSDQQHSNSFCFTIWYRLPTVWDSPYISSALDCRIVRKSPWLLISILSSILANPYRKQTAVGQRTFS